MTIKVLQVTSKSLGGSGTYIELLSRGLRSRHVQVGLCYRSGSSQDGRLESAMDSVWHFPKPVGFNPWYTMVNIWFLMRLLRRERPDIIHSHTSLGGLVGRVAGFLARVPARVHTAHAFGADEFTPQPVKTIYQIIEWLLDRVTTHTICVSRHMLTYGSRLGLLTASRSVVIYNTIGDYPVPLATERAGLRTRIRDELGLADDQVVFLFAGRLEEQKGLVYLVDAARILVEAHPEGWAILLAGQGSQRDMLANRISELGLGDRVRFLGWRQDLPALFCASDVFVLPSIWESFGLVNLEAMAFNLPVLATDTQGIPEVVSPETGILVPIRDPERLADGMLRLMRDPDLRQRLGQEGLSCYQRRFTYEAHIEKHMEVYNQICARCPAH